MSVISNSLEDLSFDNFDDPLVEDIAERLHRKRKRMFEETNHNTSTNIDVMYPLVHCLFHPHLEIFDESDIICGNRACACSPPSPSCADLLSSDISGKVRLCGNPTT